MSTASALRGLGDWLNLPPSEWDSCSNRYCSAVWAVMLGDGLLGDGLHTVEGLSVKGGPAEDANMHCSKFSILCLI